VLEVIIHACAWITALAVVIGPIFIVCSLALAAWDDMKK
jgi:hypothetical protein